MSVSTNKKEQPAEQKTQAQEKRVFVVLNPVAGTTDASAAKQTITQYCQDHGWECDIHETKKNEDLRHLVQDALKKQVDIVIAAGGDGTVSQVVSGMVNSHTPMGILPAGTGNNLARNLSIPMDLQGALDLLGSEYDIQELDVMEVNKDKYYVLNVSVGVSSLVMRKTPREQKRRFGFLAYLWNAAGSIRSSDMHRFLVKADDRSVKFSASELMIANCKFMGLQPQLDEVEIDPEDGRLDVFIMRTQTFRDYLGVAAAFLTRRKSEEEQNLDYIEAHNFIQIELEFPLPAQADGEVIGTTPLEIRLLPKSLRVIVPQKAPAAS